MCSPSSQQGSYLQSMPQQPKNICSILLQSMYCTHDIVIFSALFLDSELLELVSKAYKESLSIQQQQVIVFLMWI